MSVSTEAINKLATIGIYRQLIKKLLDYPSINRLEVYLETKRLFRQNKFISDPSEIEKELRKAKLGLAHVQLYVTKSKELTENYTNTSEAFDNSLNPKDDNFVYF